VGFSGTEQRVDELQFRVWIDDDKQLITKTFMRKPGGTDAKLELDLKDYDLEKFHTVHVIVIGREKGVAIGGAKSEATIEDKCTAVSMYFSASYKYCAQSTDCDGGVCPDTGCCGSSSFGCY
jgi:hypothetical protein